MRKKVLVLGGTGMLGSMVVDVLSRDDALAVCATARSRQLIETPGGRIDNVSWTLLDALDADGAQLAQTIGEAEWVVNAIGLTKPCIHDDNAAEVERAIRVNSLFPHLLAKAAEARNSRVIQIATDCVFSGVTGGCAEDAPHDALDAYGKTKSLGEVVSDHVHHLRCSIVGPEPKDFKFLLHWFLGRPRGDRVNGFTNHRWNGVTTLHFARLCRGIIKQDIRPARVQHVTPLDVVTKSELLECFARSFDRGDITVCQTQSSKSVDRTLATSDQGANRALWAAAGYSSPPAIADMVAEMATFDYRMAAEAGCDGG